MDDVVESMDGLRGMVGLRSARWPVGGCREEEAIVGEGAGDTGEPAARTGADTLRCTVGLLLTGELACLEASSLNASLVTALRSSSCAALLGTLVARVGIRTRSWGSRGDAGGVTVDRTPAAVCVACRSGDSCEE